MKDELTILDVANGSEDYLRVANRFCELMEKLDAGHHLSKKQFTELVELAGELESLDQHLDDDDRVAIVAEYKRLYPTTPIVDKSDYCDDYLVVLFDKPHKEVQ